MYTNIQRVPEARHEEAQQHYHGFERFRELEGGAGSEENEGRFRAPVVKKDSQLVNPGIEFEYKMGYG